MAYTPPDFAGVIVDFAGTVRRDFSTVTDLEGSCGVCFDPPPAECLDSYTLRTYSPFGTCVLGQCDYNPMDQDCVNGCDTGACIPDACAGITCNTPPANYCFSM